MKFFPNAALLIIVLFKPLYSAEIIKVDVNIDMNHTVGGIDDFRRDRFVVIHADALEPEWDEGWGPNFAKDLRDDFLNGYDVYLGRNSGPATTAIRKAKMDKKRPGFTDPACMPALGTEFQYNYYISKPHIFQYEKRSDIVAVGLNNVFPDGSKNAEGWALSMEDTAKNPFGKATGELLAHYLKTHYGKGGTTGQPKPTMYEIINEPMWHFYDAHCKTTPEMLFKLHKNAAFEIKKLNPEIKVGGFVTAFPDPEKRDFKQWEERWKLFMDIAGEQMDFWSIHLYDFPSNQGVARYRKGSQMEATLDLLEHYSDIKFGTPKEILVSEFGMASQDLQGKWSPLRDWVHMKSVHSMMMQFMDRPHIISKAINFLIIKATWGYNENGNTYPHRLMRREDEPGDYSGKWVYTDVIKTFELWKNVKGKRAESRSGDADILVDSYVDGNKVYIILNSLLFKRSKIQLNVPGISIDNFAGGVMKHIYLSGDEAYLKAKNLKKPLDLVKLEPEATIIFEYELKKAVKMPGLCEEIKHYAETCMQKIEAGKPNVFRISGVKKGANGEAVIRIGVGRRHGLEIFPKVKLNGNALTVIEDYKGDLQKTRESFFGVLEVSAPWELLAEDNSISVQFGDSGGYVSSLAMQVYNFNRPVARDLN